MRATCCCAPRSGRRISATRCGAGADDIFGGVSRRSGRGSRAGVRAPRSLVEPRHQRRRRQRVLAGARAGPSTRRRRDFELPLGTSWCARVTRSTARRRCWCSPRARRQRLHAGPRARRVRADAPEAHHCRGRARLRDQHLGSALLGAGAEALRRRMPAGKQRAARARTSTCAGSPRWSRSRTAS